MLWNRITHIDNLNCKIEIPAEWLLPHYYEALNILFRFENTLRVFVYIVLKKELGIKWSDISITSDDGSNTTLNAIAKKRKSQDASFGYLGYTFSSPMLHLTSGELLNIIFQDSYWKYFKEHFLGSKEIIKNKFEEIINIRNSLAHFRPIKEDDVEVVKQNILHLMKKIENQIIQLTTCNDRVPSNTKDNWYQSLKSLGNDLCNFSFHQSQNKEWIKISLDFHCPINEVHLSVPVLRIDTFTTETSPMLLKYNVLTENSIYITEYSPHVFSTQNWENSIRKVTQFIINRKNLENNFESLQEVYIKLIDDIKNEVEMILQDNPARGEIVHSIRLNGKASVSEEGIITASIDTKNLASDENNDILPEYWGHILLSSGNNFLSHTPQFPWMTDRISNENDDFDF